MMSGFGSSAQVVRDPTTPLPDTEGKLLDHESCQSGFATFDLGANFELAELHNNSITDLIFR